MATFRKIYNGMEMEGCALYEYLLTSKGFCCEKGWNWEDLDTQMTMTGRDWLAYWALNGSPCSECEAPVNLTFPTITGIPVVGETLTAGDGTWSGTAPITYTYQWKRNGADIIGETLNLYTLVIADLGADITLVVTANNNCSGGGVSATSGTFGPISGCTSPSFTTAVAIDGDTIITATLSVSDNGQPSGTEPIVITYQWNLNGTPIGGATADTYEVQPADAGGNITCTVTATNACGSVSDVSNTIAIAAAPALLLDSYAVNTAYGWSVARQLKTSATSAITIRRSSDNATQTIGFVAGELDTAAIATFVGANSAYITTIYEQNGSGYNFTQSTAANQPRIVNAGTIELLNTKPAAAGYQNSISMNVPSSTSYFNFLHNGTSSSVFSVHAYTLGSACATLNTTSSATGVGVRIVGGSNAISNTCGNGSALVFSNSATSTLVAGTQYLFSLLIDADNATAADRSEIYYNGGTAQKNNSTSGTVSASNSAINATIMTISTTTISHYQELLVLPSQPTLSTFRTDINGFYNIY